MLNAMEAHGEDRAVVVGLPNVGKSSIITPVTRHATTVVKKKGKYHLPQVANVPGEVSEIFVDYFELNRFFKNSI